MLACARREFRRLVRGLENAADRHQVGRARERRQQVPLHFRCRGQRFRPAGASRHVGVAAFDDPGHHEDGGNRVEEGWHHAVPHVEVELQDADRARPLDQWNHDHGRVGSHDLDFTAREHPPDEAPRNGDRGTHRAVGIDLLQTSERIVGHGEPGLPCPEESTHQIEKFEHMGR